MNRSLAGVFTHIRRLTTSLNDAFSKRQFQHGLGKGKGLLYKCVALLLQMNVCSIYTVYYTVYIIHLYLRFGCVLF